MEFDTLTAYYVGSWLLSFLLGLVAHEIGHAVVGRAVGFQPYIITIGIGPVIMFRRLFGDVWLTLRALPVAGNVKFLPQQGAGRLQQAARVAGGPLANVLLLAAAGAVYLANPSTFGTEHLAVTNQESLQIFEAHLTVQMCLNAFSSAQVALLATALLPFRHKFAGRHVASDGWKLWQLAVNPNASV